MQVLITALFPLFLSPVILPALALGLHARRRRARVTEADRAAAEAGWHRKRWLLLVPWPLLVVAAWLLAPHLQHNTAGSWLLWYGVPGACAWFTLAPYFAISLALGRGSNAMRDGARSLPGYNGFLWTTCVLAAGGTNAFLIMTCSFLGPGAIALLGIVPFTCIALGLIGGLLHVARKPPSTGEEAPAPQLDDRKSLTAWQRELRPRVASDSLLQSKVRSLCWFLGGWMLASAGVSAAGDPRLAPVHVAASLATVGIYGMLTLALARHLRGSRPRPALPWMTWFATTSAALGLLSELVCLARYAAQ